MLVGLLAGWLAGALDFDLPPCFTAGYDDAVPLLEDHGGVEHTVSQQQQTQATSADAAAEAELGADPLDAGTSPVAQPSPAGQAVVTAASPADAAGPVGPAGPADDDLYADLVIPQADGAADSPPRQRRHAGRADPEERWEMGAGGSGAPAWPGTAENVMADCLAA